MWVANSIYTALILYYIYIYIHIYTYIYIYIYVICIYITNLPVNAIVRLTHPQNGDSQGQETFLPPSADKQTRNYDIRVLKQPSLPINPRVNVYCMYNVCTLYICIYIYIYIYAY